MTKLQGAFFPSATTNKLITLRSIYEEDKSRDYSSWEMMGLISGCWKELLVCSEKPYWAAWSHLHNDSSQTPFQTEKLTKSHMLLVLNLFSSAWGRHQMFSLYPYFFRPLAMENTKNKCQLQMFYVYNMFLWDVLSGNSATNCSLQ